MYPDEYYGHYVHFMNKRLVVKLCYLIPNKDAYIL